MTGSRSVTHLFGDTAPMSHTIAQGLLQVKAVELRPQQPFTWSSGWKSPIYCDNRVVLAYPVLRSHVVNGFIDIIRQHFPGIDAVSGAATGGIAHAAWVADGLGLPMSYVRGSAKGHGRQKQVEGYSVPGARVVVIEDTLSTGKSAYEAAAALQEEGMDVLAILSIFSYDFQALFSKIDDSGIAAHRLVSFRTLADTAVEHGFIQAGDLALLQRWREQPDQYESLMEKL